MARSPISTGTRRPKVLAPVHPNAGTEAALRRALDALIEDMHASLARFLTAAYRANPPVMAQDSPASDIREAMRILRRRWTSRFDEASDRLAKHYSRRMAQRSDAQLRAILKRAGIAVEFRMTPAMTDVLQATIGQQVGLIRSIGEQHLTQVEGAVMRSVQQGGDLATLTRELRERYALTKERAAFIARSQNSMATAAMTRARQQELGIESAIWLHSRGGREPRPTHLANDGKRFNVAEGWFDPDPRVQQRIWPGQLINCFPGDEIVWLKTLPARLWRAPFDGPMIHIEVGADLLKGTPNHPVLTAYGWRPLYQLDRGDEIVCMAFDQGRMVYDNERYRKAVIGELFVACAVEFGYVRSDRRRFDFHGDLPHGDVDEVVVIDDKLPEDWHLRSFENIGNLTLPDADRRIDDLGFSGQRQVSVPCPACLCDDCLPGSRMCSEAHNVGRTAIAHDTVAEQHVTHVGSRIPWGAEMRGYCGRPHAPSVEIADRSCQGIPIAPAVDFPHTDRAEFFAEFVRIAADRGSRVFQFDSATYEFRSVTNKRIGHHSGHIFTMQTYAGHYAAGSAFAQVKNCRCVSRAIVKGFT
jgi:hypothetical protein